MTDELLLVTAVEVGFVTLIVGLTFIWPLWGVHRLLEDEKTRPLRSFSHFSAAW